MTEEESNANELSEALKFQIDSLAPVTPNPVACGGERPSLDSFCGFLINKNERLICQFLRLMENEGRRKEKACSVRVFFPAHANCQSSSEEASQKARRSNEINPEQSMAVSAENQLPGPRRITEAHWKPSLLERFKMHAVFPRADGMQICHLNSQVG